MAESRQLWAPQAWIGGRWRDAVVLDIGADGCWASLTPGTAPPQGAERLAGAVLPGLVDAHSHAFQRAFVGLAERRQGGHDDFWSWRDCMYQVALRITPQALRDIASQLYGELLAGGYTQVCEFHYLHHDEAGQRHADPATMSWMLADAAAEAGIGLTLLPALYERAGFRADALREDQRRFRAGVDDVLALQAAVRGAGRSLLDCGVAVHSLRAARPETLQTLAAHSHGPLHIHVAEQTAEVDECLSVTGCRPIEWLLRHAAPDARWQLVHATHAEPAEIDGVARCGAGVVLCPGTEANLGDGLSDLPRWLAAGVPLSLGSDSQVTRDWPQEVRWLEYGQRLMRRQRNVGADPPQQPATAARLFERLLAGGAAAAGFERWGLMPGARADMLVIDEADPALAGMPSSHRLDAIVFAAPERPFSRVMVAGRWVTLRDESRLEAHRRALQLLQP